ncbi:hypothetical protein [Tropicibacter naphthalenivorans]|uniref:Excalibur calcium-binding domain-containing protein n=1 Tax=Tropicibacter naphthalenivorans TaxID=441103 RepID=A0A0P1GKE4_9RHOB|nr:hypothetical protein [Tropicibacter naphthalenivorans]CUH76507.1 hypothetical protein TRN7648_00971 [Tropicibacter naphthalenivorans]SMC65727.1 hypothetical protein SAMN04488093_102647 [Tropicibacter naphthalenivorans]
MRYFLCGVAALALSACSPSVPDSAAGVVDTGQGVGFGNYAEYQRRREQALINGSPMTVPGPAGVQATPLDDAQDVAAEAAAAARAAALNSGQAPLEASPGNPAPQIVSNAAGISGENDFAAVSAERDIKQDAALIAQNRAQYQIIQPEALPTRPGSNRPNIVEYALRTTNPVGTALYNRSSFNAASKYDRACGSYASADLAQEEFLALGGPEKDRKGMDPDGDGFACTWSPAPFRAARGG